MRAGGAWTGRAHRVRVYRGRGAVAVGRGRHCAAAGADALLHGPAGHVSGPHVRRAQGPSAVHRSRAHQYRLIFNRYKKNFRLRFGKECAKISLVF